jgi:hypothetical protein
MSPVGTERKCWLVHGMSAFGGKPDVGYERKYASIRPFPYLLGRIDVGSKSNVRAVLGSTNDGNGLNLDEPL